MSLTPLMLTGGHIGRTITVRKKDGTTINGVLEAYTLSVYRRHIRTTKTHDGNYPSTVNVIESRYVTSLGDSTLLIGDTRIHVTDGDTITVEE